MPEVLQYVLSAKLSDYPRISVVGYDTGASIIIAKCIQETVSNCLELSDATKAHIHLILFSHDIANFHVPPQRMNSDITAYDFLRNPFDGIEYLYEAIMKNVAAKPGRAHIMLIDDYAMFSIMCTSRDTRRQLHFMRLINAQFRKVFLFFYKESLSKEEIGMIYDIGSEIAFLQLHPESYGPATSSSSKFVCDLLKVRADRRVTHDKSVFHVTADEFKEELLHDSTEKEGSNSSEVLKNLTTFKLTLEEDERESKNKLNLPYFEAQKTSLEDPENYDDFEDDEEDEEV